MGFPGLVPIGDKHRDTYNPRKISCAHSRLRTQIATVSVAANATRYTIDAVRRFSSNMFLNCLQGPIRNMVANSDTRFPKEYKIANFTGFAIVMKDWRGHSNTTAANGGHGSAFEEGETQPAGTVATYQKRDHDAHRATRHEANQACLVRHLAQLVDFVHEAIAVATATARRASLALVEELFELVLSRHPAGQHASQSHTSSTSAQSVGTTSGHRPIIRVRIFRRTSDSGNHEHRSVNAHCAGNGRRD